MFDSPEEILQKIRLGEDSSLKLTAVTFRGDRIVGPSRADLADEIAAMANTADGVVVLGVDDRTREILGVPLVWLDAIERFVFEACNESIVPPVVFRAYRMMLPDSGGVEQAVLKLEIPRSLLCTGVRAVISTGREVQNAKCPPTFWDGFFNSAARQESSVSTSNPSRGQP